MKKYLFLIFQFCICCTYGQLLKPGMAVITMGLSGAYLDSLVIKIVDIRDHATAPVGNNWSASFITPASPLVNQWKYPRLGNIFSLAIDDSANIYACATNVYGFPQYGSAGAAGIYKFNAMDGKVNDIVTTDISSYYKNTLHKIPNKGDASLGDICFDYLHQQLFVSNFEDGKIYRLSLNGEIKSLFDPFLPDDSIAGTVAINESVYGLGFTQTTNDSSSLFFSRWGTPNQLWSIALNPQTGDFEDSAHFEFDLPPSQQFIYPVSDMAFSGDSILVMAERGVPHLCRQLTYKKINGSWVFNKTNLIGCYGTHDNSAGGIDIGYESFSGNLNGSVKCDQMIWNSGDAIKFPGFNPDGSNDYLYGMAGYPITGNSLAIGAPDYYFTHSVFVDFNNDISTTEKTYMGDVEIYRRNCRLFSNTPQHPIPDEPIGCLLTNVITPNGDTKNDYLNFNCDYPEMKLNVFNRWGSLVYQNDNYQNNWSPVNLVDGVYYYTLFLPERNPVHGFFQLIK